MDTSSQPESGEPVAVLTLRTVKAGNEGIFEAALHEFIASSLRIEGQVGVHVIRPAPASGSREYGILRRFSNAASRDRFYGSAFFQQWEERVAQLTEGGASRQELTGLEAWFTLPARREAAPPRWKMALVTLLGVYPVSILVPWLLSPLTGTLHPLVQAFFIAAGIVILLTWVVMPVLVKILRGWLNHS